MAGLNLAVSSMCELNSTFRGQDRQSDKFRLVAYPTAKGCAAEANALICHENVAWESNTSGFRAMFVRFVPHSEGAAVG